MTRNSIEFFMNIEASSACRPVGRLARARIRDLNLYDQYSIPHFLDLQAVRAANESSARSTRADETTETTRGRVLPADVISKIVIGESEAAARSDSS